MEVKMRSFIGWIGGKSHLKNQIISLIPSDSNRYIEVCGGAGWVLFGKDKIKGKKNRTYEAWRNYFTTGEPEAEWDNLVDQGLASRQDFPRGGGDDPKAYFVSLEGFEFLGELLSVKITEMD